MVSTLINLSVQMNARVSSLIIFKVKLCTDECTGGVTQLLHITNFMINVGCVDKFMENIKRLSIIEFKTMKR